MLNIPELIKEHHQAMIEAGFYDCPKCGGTGDYASGSMGSCGYCDGSGIDQNKNIGELLMLIVSELSEALEAHRGNRFAYTDGEYPVEEMIEDFNSENPILKRAVIKSFENLIKDTFEDEIADVFLRLFDLCGYLNIEIENFGYFGKLSNIGEAFLLISGDFVRFHQAYLIYKDKFEKPIFPDLNAAFGGLLWLCKELNIPIEKHIIAKMAYNKTREHKHGKAY